MQSEDTPGAQAPLSIEAKLRLLGDIDRAAAEARSPDAMVEAMVEALRKALGVPSVELHRPGSDAPDVECLVVPVRAGGELIGALSFGGGTDAIPEHAVALAREVVPRLGIALQHARLAGRLQEANARLAATRRELESLCYSVSHDLRAPLRAIDGYARMLERESGERMGEEGRRLLGAVRASAHRMGRLIEDLLELSRIGQVPMEPALVDMTALAREVAAELGRDFPGTAIRVAALPQVRGDRALLRRAWVQLVGNALKFSARSTAPTVEISGAHDAAGARYWVQDNGAGFDMRYAGRLFGPFQRLHRQDDFPGNGIGLAIVHRIVSRHGGDVAAEGVPGGGARFSFLLPSR